MEFDSRIKAEMAHVNAKVGELIPESKKTGKNVALGVTGYFLIVPLFFMDFSDAEKVEIETYQQRYLALQKLYERKNCNASEGTLVENNPLEGSAPGKDGSADGTTVAVPAVMAEAAATMATEETTIPVAAQNDVQTRLKVLEDLKSAGLISDEEYAAKRKALLDEI